MAYKEVDRRQESGHLSRELSAGPTPVLRRLLSAVLAPI